MTSLPPTAQSLTQAVSPRRSLTCCITTSCVSMMIAISRTVTPGEGAVCPATVMKGVVTSMGDVNAIVPLTSNTTKRGPLAVIAARRNPGPESFRLVTL